jgi:hypothetical protein
MWTRQADEWVTGGGMYQECRSPWAGLGRLRSVLSSLYMLFSEPGTLLPRGTEKHSPIAWPGAWYGSCPRMTTLTRAKAHVLNARNTISGGGNTFALPARSPCTNCHHTPRAVRQRQPLSTHTFAPLACR